MAPELLRSPSWTFFWPFSSRFVLLINCTNITSFPSIISTKLHGTFGSLFRTHKQMHKFPVLVPFQLQCERICIISVPVPFKSCLNRPSGLLRTYPKACGGVVRFHLSVTLTDAARVAWMRSLFRRCRSTPWRYLPVPPRPTEIPNQYSAKQTTGLLKHNIA